MMPRVRWTAVLAGIVLTLASAPAARRPACLRQRGEAAIRTLAFITTVCREVTEGAAALRQSLRIRRGDCAAVTVAELGIDAPVPDPLGLCRLFGEQRGGEGSIAAGSLQRLAVSPDGSGVVFEVTDDFSLLVPNTLEGEQEGFFFVRADGTGLRRLGPASRDPTFRLVPDATSPLGFQVSLAWKVAFSPDGRLVAFTDRAPGATGADAVQLFTLELATGRRTQITRRSPSVDGSLEFILAVFLDDRTLGFAVDRRADDRRLLEDLFTVRTDGSELRPVAPVAVAGSRVVPYFAVGGGRKTAFTAVLSDTTASGARVTSSELFVVEGRNLLQLTNFGRRDTTSAILDRRGRRAYFTASADPFGTNPTENCQLFSIDALGGGLRQLTGFQQGGRAAHGCAVNQMPPGCTIRTVAQDRATGTLVFASECDPFGTNPYGYQVFAMRPDGSRLRQLTDARGLTIAPDGALTVELPGPTAYSSFP
jgi:hypothetical protein